MKDRKILLPALLVLFVTLVIAAVPTEAEAAIYEDTVRLHILANSDSENDQELKLAVRDRILEEFSKELSPLADIDEAESKIKKLLPEIEMTAKAQIEECGYDYSVTAELIDEWYQTRDYGEFSLPAGYYSSLVIRIGEAEGKNWWCVMFPPMCTEIATSDKGSSYTDAEKGLIAGGKYRLKFKTLELINECFFK